MRTALSLLTLALVLGRYSYAEADRVEVVATLNVLASTAHEIGGNRVHVQSLARPNQDPHTLVAKPTYKVMARKADLFIELGLSLDLWAKAVTDASGNPDIQLGQKGHVIATDGITTKELPATLSKAWGDIHPQGNPHVWLDPVNMKQIAKNIEAGLERVDPAGTATYKANLKKYQHRIDDSLYGHALVEEYGASKLERLSRRNKLISYIKAKKTYDKLGGWLKRAENLRGLKILTYHKTWIYFCDRFGIDIRGEIEEKPGIPPSQSWLAQLISKVKREGIKVLFVDTVYPSKDGNYIAGKTSAKVVRSPIDVHGVPGADDYFKLIDTLISRIQAAAR